jgi:hypothetical protein
MVRSRCRDAAKQLKPPQRTASLLLLHLVNEMKSMSPHLPQNSRKIHHAGPIGTLPSLACLVWKQPTAQQSVSVME